MGTPVPAPSFHSTRAGKSGIQNPDGSTEPNAYIVATNEFHLGDDFNDIVVVIRNVQPVATP